MRDPNVLLTTIAKITSTFVAILGGFLLTMAIRNRADIRRHRRRIERLNRLIARSRGEREAREAEWATGDERLTQVQRQVYQRFWRGELTRDQAIEEEIRLLKEEIALIEEEQRFSEERIRQLEADEFDDTLIMDEVRDLEHQFRDIGYGLFLLMILGIFGIGIPLLMMPMVPADQFS